MIKLEIPIIYFSSSGNTKYVANLIKNGLILANFVPVLMEYNSIKNKNFNFEDFKAIGIGAPIYAMAFTLNMLEWVKNLPRLRKKVFRSIREKPFLNEALALLWIYSHVMAKPSLYSRWKRIFHL